MTPPLSCRRSKQKGNTFAAIRQRRRQPYERTFDHRSDRGNLSVDADLHPPENGGIHLTERCLSVDGQKTEDHQKGPEKEIIAATLRMMHTGC